MLNKSASEKPFSYFSDALSFRYSKPGCIETHDFLLQQLQKHAYCDFTNTNWTKPSVLTKWLADSEWSFCKSSRGMTFALTHPLPPFDIWRNPSLPLVSPHFHISSLSATSSSLCCQSLCTNFVFYSPDLLKTHDCFNKQTEVIPKMFSVVAIWLFMEVKANKSFTHNFRLNKVIRVCKDAKICMVGHNKPF